MGELPFASTLFFLQMAAYRNNGRQSVLSSWNIAYPGSAAGLCVTWHNVVQVETRNAAHLSLRQVVAPFWAGLAVCAASHFVLHGDNDFQSKYICV